MIVLIPPNCWTAARVSPTTRAGRRSGASSRLVPWPDEPAFCFCCSRSSAIRCWARATSASAVASSATEAIPLRACSARPWAMSHCGDSGRNHKAAATMRAAGTAPTANMARHISLLEKARLTR